MYLKKNCFLRLYPEYGSSLILQRNTFFLNSTGKLNTYHR